MTQTETASPTLTATIDEVTALTGAAFGPSTWIAMASNSIEGVSAAITSGAFVATGVPNEPSRSSVAPER